MMYVYMLAASKEWVIPAKPKPGRKPKAEAAPPLKEDEEVSCYWLLKLCALLTYDAG
jgi:hypothetical protein